MGIWRVGWMLAIALTLARSVSAATSAQVRNTIEKSKAYLYAQQLSDHTWEFDHPLHGDQKTGQTALAVYALLASGESPQDPRLVPAIKYLKETPATGVYALGVRCQLWLMLPQTASVRAAMVADAIVLLKSVQRSGSGKGFDDYNPGGQNYSHSRSQYAVLGLWAAAQSGIEIPSDYWKLIQAAWIGHQDPNGGWNYIYKDSHYPLTAGMTAAGVATLLIADEQLATSTRTPAIDRGFQWLTDNFAAVATNEKSSRAYPFSTLYAIERIGVASGNKYFGTVDWYQKGADFLIASQRSDGSFPYEFEGVKTASTCFAALFLSRGSSPLLMNKLDYSVDSGGKESHWNQRPRDVANAARWIGKQFERELNWQVVNLDSPLADLLDAQILYLAGNQPLKLSAEHEAKLKLFVEQGGLIVANADGASANFSASFKAMGKRMFPEYGFAPLPDAHPIYTAEPFHRTGWKHKPTVLSLGNGAREFMILLADSDPARAWQDQRPGNTSAARDELCQLAADIFIYSVDKQNLRRRGESYLVMRDEKIQSNRTIKLARLQYSGNCDPEPGGWRRLAALFHNDDKIDLHVEPARADELGGYKLAHLTGTAAVSFSAGEREAIRKFLNAGGTLIVDCAGGSTAFATAVESELATIIPNAKQQLAEPLPANHSIFAGIKSVGYRNFARARLGQLNAPQIRGIQLDHRLAVIYSREDLSVGLVGQPVDGIIGYDPASAATIMSGAIRFADDLAK